MRHSSVAWPPDLTFLLRHCQTNSQTVSVWLPFLLGSSLHDKAYHLSLISGLFSLSTVDILGWMTPFLMRLAFPLCLENSSLYVHAG